MSDTVTPTSGGSGIGIGGVFGVLFVGLKLGHVIDWPWAYVTLPLWGPIALYIVIVLIVALLK